MAENDQILAFFKFFFTAALFLDHFTTHIKISSKSVKFQISTKNQAPLRIAPHLTFFVEIILNWLNLPIKIKKGVPKRAGPRNGHFKHKMDKKGQKMASRVKFDIKFEFFGQFYP